METDERIAPFINYLGSLAREGKEDRGALADLRSGLRTDPGQAPRMFKHVVPYLEEKHRNSDRWFYVVGAMFGANPRHVKGNSIGKCFKLLSESGSDSIEARFIALLGSHPDDLHKHLYHAIGLIRSKEIGLDYYKLLGDLINWNSSNHITQNKWARDYYRKPDNIEKGEDNNE